MNELNLEPSDRSIVQPALERSRKLAEAGLQDEFCQVVSIQLEDGRIISGRHSEARVMSAVSACLLNALKALADVDDQIHMLSPDLLEPIHRLKTEILHDRSRELNAEETLNVLCVCAANNEQAKRALDQITSLRGCQAHSTCMLDTTEEQLLRRLGIDVTCEPKYANNNLYDEQ